MNIIHVYDWDGNLVQKIETDYSIGQMWIDPIRNRLYVTNPQIDDVLYLDLDDFLVPNTGL
jgi:predicted nucleotidyltransferase